MNTEMRRGLPKGPTEFEMHGKSTHEVNRRFESAVFFSFNRASCVCSICTLSWSVVMKSLRADWKQASVMMIKEAKKKDITDPLALVMHVDKHRFVDNEIDQVCAKAQRQP